MYMRQGHMRSCGMRGMNGNVASAVAMVPE